MSLVGSLNILVGMDIKDVQAGTGAARKELKGLGRDARQIWDETRTPQEQYEQRLGRLAEHVRQGAIDQDTFARAVREASIELSEQGQGSGEGFEEGSAALDAYRGRMEQLTQQLSAGSITQAQFSSGAHEAADSLSSVSAASAEAHAGHQRGASAAKVYDDRVRHLHAALQSGRIDFQQYSHGVAEAREAMERAERSAQRMEKAVELGKLALETFGIGLGLEYAVDLLKDAVIEAENAAASLRKLEAITRATGEASGFTAKELAKLAEEHEAVTSFSHLEIEAGEALLETHKNLSGENFERATEYMLDLAEVMGTDVKSAALQMGRALEDPVNGLGGLSRAGIQFSASEKQIIADLVEAGRITEAQGVVLDKFKGKLDGVAEAGQTAAARLRHERESFLEALGTGFGAVPFLQDKLSFLDFTRRPGAGEQSEPAPEAQRPDDLETKSHREARQEIDKLVESLKEEIATQGQSAEAIAIAKAKREGLTDAELDEAQALVAAREARKRDTAALAEQKKQIDDLANSAKRLREQQAAANEQFGKEGLGAEEARLDALEKQIDARLAKKREGAEVLQGAKDRGQEIGDRGEQLLAEYEELKRARQDVEDARKNLSERREKETGKSKSEALDKDLQSLEAATRTPKEELEGEMAELKDLYRRATEAAKAKGEEKLAPEVDEAFHRKADDLKQKYADLDKPEAEKEKPEAKEHDTHNAALEEGTAEAFHASFGQSKDSQTWKQMLVAAQKQQRDTERLRQIQEKNQTQTASFG